MRQFVMFNKLFLSVGLLSLLKVWFWLASVEKVVTSKIQVSVENVTNVDVKLIQEESQNYSTKCSVPSDLEKFDCHPDAGVTLQRCLKRGCCHHIISKKKRTFSSSSYVGIPSCYFPYDYAGYKVLNITRTVNGLSALFKRVMSSGLPNDIKIVRLDVAGLNDNVVRIRVTDNNQKRFEVPLFKDVPPKRRTSKNKMYRIKLSSEGLLRIVRRSSDISLFHSNLEQLIFSDQFLQLSTKLPSPTVYGLGEHYDHIFKNMNWTRITLFNKDNFPAASLNLYGSHPFYISIENDSSSHGVFLLNSNAMDVVFQPTPALTYRTIGGILDFFVFLGPKPSDVVAQYTSIVGRSFMPPYWSLGFHLCRFGMKSLNETKKVLQRNKNVGIPLEVQWNDMDYMEKNNDFTYDKIKFSGLPEFVDELHKQKMRYVIMVDPGVSGSEKPGTYPPYDDAVKDNLLIKNDKGGIFIGKVWNMNTTVFPDFSHPATSNFWAKQFRSFHELIPFDGAWIDMNEISNFYNGTLSGCPKNSTLDNPPYLPGDKNPLYMKTLCMSAKHYSTSHYNEHNLHSYREAVATDYAMRNVTGKRPFIISRATFAGQGHYSGHWSGDVSSSWEDMRYSINNMLSFNMFGISMVGSDICGFRKNTTVELCARWSALGAFYPFSRNHNDRTSMDQDPAAMGERVVKSIKHNLYVRYTLLPYLYTLFYRSYVYGETVARPMFFEFIKDSRTYTIEEQFLWGPALMIMPVLYPGAIHVEAYFPRGIWYDLSGARRISMGEYVVIPSTHDRTAVSVRGGYILPMQYPSKTTVESRLNKFMLFVGLDENNKANGELFWDDGESVATVENNSYNLITFEVVSNILTSTVSQHGYESEMQLGLIRICTLNSFPSAVTINGKNVSSKLDQHKVFTSARLSTRDICSATPSTYGKIATPSSVPEARPRGGGVAILPYVEGVAEQISRVLRRADVKTYYKPEKTLRNLLMRVKDSVPEE